MGQITTAIHQQRSSILLREMHNINQDITNKSPGVTTQCTQSVERSPSKSPREHHTTSVRRFLMRSVLQYTMKNVTQWSKKCPGKSVPIIIMKNIMKRSTMLIMFTMTTIMITILTLNYTMLQNKENFLLFQQQRNSSCANKD